MNESENTTYHNLWDTEKRSDQREIYSCKYLHLQKKEYLKSIT